MGDRDRGTDRCTGRNAVVDDDRGAPGKVVTWSCPSYRTEQSLELAPFSRSTRGELLVTDPSRPENVVIHDDHTVLADRSHRQLGLAGNTDLADHDHIQWSADCRSHFGGDRNSAAGNPSTTGRSSRSLATSIPSSAPAVRRSSKTRRRTAGPARQPVDTRGHYRVALRLGVTDHHGGANWLRGNRRHPIRSARRERQRWVGRCRRGRRDRPRH